MPGPVRMAAARSAMAATNGSASPTATTAEIGHAALSGRSVASSHQCIGGGLDVGVGQHHGVVLGPAQRLDALAGGGGRLVDVPGHRRGADEGHGRHSGVSEKCVDGSGVAVDDREHPVGQPGLAPEVADQSRRRGVAFGGLENEGVPTGDGHRIHPHRDHDREVEGGDSGHHPERLSDRRGVHPARHLLRELTLQQMGDAAGELDHLDTPGHLPAGILQDLPVLGGDRAGEVLAVAVTELAEGEEDAAAGGERRPPPLLPRRPGGADGAVDVVGRGQHHLGHLASGGGVEDG